MGTIAPSFQNLTAADGEPAGHQFSTEALAQRAKNRLLVQGVVAVSYLVDAAILFLYAYAGAVSQWIGPIYALLGLALVGAAILMSETGISERFNDHYMVTPLSAANVLIMIGFAYVVPQVGIVFLCSLIVMFSLVSQRSPPAQIAVVWTVMVLGLAGLLLLTDKPVGMPHGNQIERFATLLVLTLTVGRCAFVGIFSNSLKQTLYRRGLKLKEAYQRIEELAELDELTGSYNRRCIMRMLEEEIARAARNGSPCSVALIDLDHFKRINDTYGHPTGDEVLRTFAIAMFANIRSVDRFGRYGGEEFLLVLPDLPNEGAALALDRLRAIVADLDWSAFSPGMKVTLSAGVATLRPNETTDSFLARADRALYAAKAKGRNRIARV